MAARKTIIFIAGAAIGAFLALLYANVINVAILKFIPAQPPEVRDDPYMHYPWGETWR